MANITVTNLTSGGTGTDATSFVTASVSPTAGKLVLCNVYVQEGAGTPPVPTLSGNSLTWTNTGDRTQGAVRVFTFRAVAANPTSGAITIDFSGNTQSDCMWIVDEIAGLDLGGANGANAIVQTAGNSTGGATSLTVTLAAFSNTENATYGFTMMINSPVINPGTGFTEIAEASGPHSVQTQWKNSNDTTVDWSWANSSIAAAVAFELKPAPLKGGIFLAHFV